MNIPFFKYQGTGNDFIIVDHFEEVRISPSDRELIEQLCDRKFGIGADGLIMLTPHPDADFEMLYFNADGRPGSLCGNGSRC
ncbi:MAG: diaminopimelate epimerase, partial [Saprospiraceae bacterium]|nr:diaminopimelate epimerase [Saprospiraceae bacterium]